MLFGRLGGKRGFALAPGQKRGQQFEDWTPSLLPKSPSLSPLGRGKVGCSRSQSQLGPVSRFGGSTAGQFSIAGKGSGERWLLLWQRC